MKKKQLYLLAAGVVMGSLSSCIDDNYDLSDINTTSEFKVKDLELPVQLDPVELSDIITVKEGDKIHEVTINGHTFYAVEQTGEFHSDPVHVNEFTAKPEHLSTTTATFRTQPTRAGESQKIYLLLNEVRSEFDYSSTDIDGTIRDLTYAEFKPTGISFTIVNSLGSNIGAGLENLKVSLPEGLRVTAIQTPGKNYPASAYDIATGMLTLPQVAFQNGEANVTLTADAVNVDSKWYNYNESKNVGEFNLDSELTIKEGKLTLTASAQDLASIGDEVNFQVKYALGNMDVTSILGSVKYDLKGNGLNIDPIEINDLPDFLESEETNLILANPQIYLSLNNPVGGMNLKYQSGMLIKALRNNGPDASFPLDAFVVPASGEGPFNYVLAPDPSAVTEIPSQFASGLTRVTYNNLGNILSGKGIPNTLDIELVNPEIPLQKLSTPLQLGQDLQEMKGTYQFLAPLALEGDATSGSQIIYTHTADGWWSEDLADLTIGELTLNANVTNAIPLNASISVYPIDKDGNVISGVEVIPIEVAAGEQNKPAVFVIKGTIRNLDGVKIRADVHPDGTGEALAPSQTITLTDIKVKVSGNYTKKF